MHTSTMIMLAVTPLLGWKMYNRTRRLIGRQKLTKARPWIHLVIFSLFLGLFSYVNFSHSLNLALLYGCALFGIGMAWQGLNLTEFDTTGEGLFYTPHTWIGVGLSAAFFLAVTYRISMFVLTDTTPSLSNFGRTPALVAVFGTFAGYNMTYALGLLRWRARVRRSEASAEGASS